MEIDYLLSTDYLKTTLKKHVGYTPSSDQAFEITSCLRQGREYFESAKKSQQIIRPLLVFYGMSALAKAVILSRSRLRLAALKASHGLSDVSASDAAIPDLCLRINGTGTFAEFNDVIRRLEGINFPRQKQSVDIFLPSDATSSFVDERLTLKNIFSRCPQLGADYRITFGEPSSTTYVSLTTGYNDENETVLTVIANDDVNSLDELRAVVTKLRETMPFLGKFSVTEVRPQGSYSAIDFMNFEPDATEFTRLQDLERNGRFEYRLPYSSKFSDKHELFAVEDFLPSISGGVAKSSNYYIHPFNGFQYAEWSLFYMGAFLLGSMSRYHPDRWVHTISRRSTATRGRTDQSLGILNEFLQRIEKDFPAYIANTFFMEIPATGKRAAGRHINVYE